MKNLGEDAIMREFRKPEYEGCETVCERFSTPADKGKKQELATFARFRKCLRANIKECDEASTAREAGPDAFPGLMRECLIKKCDKDEKKHLFDSKQGKSDYSQVWREWFYRK